MASLDITLEKDDVDTIVFAKNFGEREYVKHLGKGDIAISDSGSDPGEGGYIEVSRKDIPNLIKALQKAQEIWVKK